MKFGRLMGFLMVASAALFLSACGDDDCSNAVPATSTAAPAKTNTPVLPPPTATSAPATATSAPATATSAPATATSAPATATPPPGEETATPTPPPGEDTATPTGTPTSAPATPTSPPAGGDERIFSLSRPGCELDSSGLGGFDVSVDPWEGGPLVLVKGATGPDGVAPLSLKQDVIVTLSIIDGSRACISLKAAGSSGSIDCDGGSSMGVTVTVNSHGGDPADPQQTQTGQGGNSGAGAATLSVQAALANLPAGATAADCVTANYAYEQMALSTGSVNVVVQNPKQGGGTMTFEKTGENFDCAAFTTEDGAGMLLLGLPALDTVVGDLVNMLVLADREPL